MASTVRREPRNVHENGVDAYLALNRNEEAKAILKQAFANGLDFAAMQPSDYAYWYQILPPLSSERSNRMYTVMRQTIRERLQKLNEVNTELQRRMHDPIPEVGKWLER